MIEGFFKVIFIIVISFLFSCQKIKPTAKQILKKSLKAHGGLELWQKIDTLSFTKKTILYNQKGIKEKEITQNQSFYGGIPLHGKISSFGTEKSSISVINGVYVKSIRDSLVSITDDEIKAINNSFKSAYYVISQPFNLKESNAFLFYKKDTILDGEKTFVVDVFYKEDENTNTPDKWTYFFNAKTFLVVAAKVFHSPTISFIKNTKFNTKTPFVFNSERVSVFMNNDGTEDYTRAAYFYSNYKVVLKK